MKKKILINFSNHPSHLWLDEQLEAAKQYGEIIDMEFPIIDPKEDETYIKKLAKDYYNSICNKYQEFDITVHIMGEVTFCFYLINMLKACNINCIASSTNRNVVESENGMKHVKFKFEQFRRY